MKALMRLSAMSFPPFAVAEAYRSTFTPHGRMSYSAALSLKWLSFEHKIKPSPDSDLEIPLPINLIYLLSMMLPKEQVAQTRDISIPSGDEQIGGRLYWPRHFRDGGEPLPLIVYYHGGGFVVGSVDMFDAFARSLANATNAVVLSVDYRMAPASPYPSAVEDAYAALLWAAENAQELGASDQIVVAGDSAGGNLAAVSAVRARDRGGPAVAAQLLFYPATDLTNKSYPSREKFMDGYGMSNEAAEAFSEAYLGHVDEADRAHPDISPMYAAHHKNLPPALVVTAGFDPMTDCSQTYAAKLRNSGVHVVEDHHPHTLHGFMSISLFPERRLALKQAGAFLADVLEAARERRPRVRKRAA